MRSSSLVFFFVIGCALAALPQEPWPSVTLADPVKVQAAPPSAFEHYSISGIVRNAKGKPVKGAEVTLADPETNFRAKPVMTNSNGEFMFTDLTASRYHLQATKGKLSSDATDVQVGSEKVTHQDLVVK